VPSLEEDASVSVLVVVVFFGVAISLQDACATSLRVCETGEVLAEEAEEEQAEEEAELKALLEYSSEAKSGRSFGTCNSPPWK
jgi:hypothetical protein